MTALITVLLVAATLVTAGWCVLYQVITRGGWWSTEADGANWHGRNLMALAVVLALMEAFTLLGPFLPAAVLAWVAVVLFSAEIAVMVHRGYLLVTDQRRAHPRDVARDAARDKMRDEARDAPRDKARDAAHDETL
jgi:hypothetical protein